MDLLFLGGLFPKYLELEVIKNSKGDIQFAANNLQWALIDGLDLVNKKPIQLCNVMFIGSYPKGYKKLYVKTGKFNHHPDIIDTNYGFFNLYGFSMFFRCFASCKGVIKWAKQETDEKIIIVYAVHTPFLLASYITKFLFPKIKICIVAPDLPNLMSNRKNIIYRTLKLIDKSIINLCLTKADAFVLVSDLMKEKLKIKERPWVRVEGIFSSNRYDFIREKEKNKTLMYSGNLDLDQGIIELLNSFSLIKDENYRLWITGYGNSLSTIIKASEKDFRIKYWSKLNQNDLFNLLQRATLLINPLKSNHKKTKYFFPSKIMEYMASGTPTLMYDLPCMPKEYDEYLFYIKDTTVEGMRDKIIKICSMPQAKLIDFGLKAQEFILRRKNPEVQCKKIHAMLQKLFN